MQTARIIREIPQVTEKLEFFGATKEEIAKIALAAVMAGNDSVATDPVNAKGQLMYIYGTRALREVFLSKGWIIDRTGNIEAVYNPKTGIKIVYQNTDSATDLTREPKARSNKGPSTEKMIEDGQLYLFTELAEEERARFEDEKKRANANVWFLCTAVLGDGVYAELSFPKSLDDGQFNGFHERIFILQNGVATGIDVAGLANDIEDQDFEIKVTRKQT